MIIDCSSRWVMGSSLQLVTGKVESRKCGLRISYPEARTSIERSVVGATSTAPNATEFGRSEREHTPGLITEYIALHVQLLYSLLFIAILTVFSYWLFYCGLLWLSALQSSYISIVSPSHSRSSSCTTYTTGFRFRVLGP